MILRRLLVLAALSIAALPAARAQVFGSPPTDSYTFNLVLQDAKGKVLYQETRKCDPLRWCDGTPYTKDVKLLGQTRHLFVKPKWEMGELRYQWLFDRSDAPSVGPHSADFPFRKNGKEVRAFYDTASGVAYQNSAEFKKGAIAKLTMTISY